MFNKESVILDIVSEHPETEIVFKPYDEVVGKCVMCNNLFDKLGDFTSKHGIDYEKLVKELKDKVSSEK
ncbi:MAG: hypothetical protein GX219_06815 [Tissierellia bacterium]|nr:hypothetical protein [Tissierellia bacterium]